MSNLEIVRKAMTSILEDFTLAALDNIPLYFSPDYKQKVNGVSLDYDGIVGLLRTQRETLASLTINFENMFEGGDMVASHHTVVATKKDGSQSSHRMIAIFELKDGKIISAREVVQMLSGSEEDRNVGSNIEL